MSLYFGDKICELVFLMRVLLDSKVKFLTFFVLFHFNIVEDMEMRLYMILETMLGWS